MVVHLKRKISLAARIMEVADEFWNAQTTVDTVQKKICLYSCMNRQGTYMLVD